MLAAVGAPLVCLFARWDEQTTTFTGGASMNGPATIRGDLPAWAAAWETIDERLPGGMYEATVRQVLNERGRYWCSVYWLTRNRMFGLTKALFGKPIGEHERPAWYRSKRLGWLYLGAGWKKYRATPQASWIDGPFVQMPSVTVRVLRGKDE